MAIFGVRPPKIKVNPDLVDIGFTTTFGSDLFTPSGTTTHGLKNGDRIRFATDGTLPAPLVAGTIYWVIASEGGENFKISTSRGGGIFNLTDNGTGNHTYSADREILLDAVKWLKDEPVQDEKEIKFPLLGERHFLERGNYWRIQIQVNLYKYSNPRAKFEELYFIRYKHKLVELWLHRDATDPILADDANTPATARWRCTELRRFYHETTKFRDGIIMTFESTTHVNLSDASDWEVSQAIEQGIIDKVG